MDDTVIAAETPAEKTYFDSGGKEPAPTTVEQPDAAPVAEQPQAPQMVPHAALHEERERAKRYAAELQRERQDRAKLEGRFEVLERLARGDQERQAPKIPGKDEDIVGNLDGRLAQQEAELTTFRQWQQNQAQENQRQQQLHGFRGAVAAREDAFRQGAPDYDDATNFLRKSRDEELQFMGYDDPGLRQQIIDGEAIALANQAMQQGKDPAKGFYDMATRRGYKKAPAASPEQRAETIKNGLAAGRSIGGAGGGSTPKALSPEAILAMSDDEFDKLKDGDWKKAFGVRVR